MHKHSTADVSWLLDKIPKKFQMQFLHFRPFPCQLTCVRHCPMLPDSVNSRWRHSRPTNPKYIYLRSLTSWQRNSKRDCTLSIIPMPADPLPTLHNVARLRIVNMAAYKPEVHVFPLPDAIALKSQRQFLHFRPFPCQMICVRHCPMLPDSVNQDGGLAGP
jgi:hypothetical protein